MSAPEPLLVSMPPKPDRRTGGVAALASLVLFVLVSWADYATGPFALVDLFYVLPIGVAAWFTGPAFAMLIALASAAVTPALQYVRVFGRTGELLLVWNVMMRAGLLAFGAEMVVRVRRAVLVQADLIERLQRALQEIKRLEGLLPICAWCHKIRDDAGAWRRLEAYITEHSDAQFTHGICPECAQKLPREPTGGGTTRVAPEKPKGHRP